MCMQYVCRTNYDIVAVDGRDLWREISYAANVSSAIRSEHLIMVVHFNSVPDIESSRRRNSLPDVGNSQISYAIMVKCWKSAFAKVRTFLRHGVIARRINLTNYFEKRDGWTVIFFVSRDEDCGDDFFSRDPIIEDTRALALSWSSYVDKKIYSFALRCDLEPHPTHEYLSAVLQLCRLH